MSPVDEPPAPTDASAAPPARSDDARSATASTPVTAANTTISRPNLPAQGYNASSTGPIPSLHIPPLGATGFTTGAFGATGTAQPALIQFPARRTVVPWLVVGAIVTLAYVFRTTLTLGFSAFAVAYIVSPLVRRVERWGVPRPLAILLVLLGGAATVATITAMLVPELLRQTQTLIASVPSYAVAIQRVWIPWIRTHLHVHLPPRIEDALAQLGLQASSLAPRLGDLLDNTLSYTVSIVEAIFKAVVIFALTFYLLIDFDTVLDGARQLVPHRIRPRTQIIAHEIDDTLRHFVTGQLLVMGVLGSLYAVALTVVGVPAGWAIGLFAGMISFVPYLGFFVALGLAMFMALLQGHGAGPALAALGMMVAVHLLDLTLVTPRILGGRAKISPVVTILALIAGGSVFGLTGVLVAIPFASVLKVLLRELVALYQNTNFFLAGSQPASLQSIQYMTAPPSLTSELNGVLFNPTVTAGGTPLAPVAPPAPIAPNTSATSTVSGQPTDDRENKS